MTTQPPAGQGSTGAADEPHVVEHREGVFATGRSDSSPYAPYIGHHLAIYAGYAADPENRRHVASGGLVTTLLATALREGVVDGVALARSRFRNGDVGYDFDIVTEPERVQDYGTSAYFNIPIERHWRKIDEFDGRLAVCSLPCHTGILRTRQAGGRGLGNVALYVGLFCGHNNEPELIRFVLEREGIDIHDVTAMRVDRTYLGGNVNFTMRDGSVRPVSFRHFNVYRSLWFFSKQLCRYCDDHLAASADLSIGDIFVPEYRRKRIKHSAVIVRTSRGAELMELALSRGVLHVDEIDEQTVFRAQKRIILPSGDLRSRYTACRLAGYSAKVPTAGTFRLRSALTYSLLLLNDRLTKQTWGPRALKWIPRPLLYAYIAVIKLINNSLGTNK